MANEFSLELTLSCSNSNSWNSQDSSSCYTTAGREPEVSNFKIAAMKVYSPSEEEEEKNVCTRLKLYEDPWTITKVLKKSDVDGSCRLLLPTHAVEEHIIKRMGKDHNSLIEKISSHDGAKITVRDCDTNMSQYELTFKRWPSTGSYVFLNNWRRDFEKRRELKCDDEIGMFWDPFDSLFWFRVLHRGPSICKQKKHV